MVTGSRGQPKVTWYEVRELSVHSGPEVVDLYKCLWGENGAMLTKTKGPLSKEIRRISNGLTNDIPIKFLSTHKHTSYEIDAGDSTDPSRNSESCLDPEDWSITDWNHDCKGAYLWELCPKLSMSWLKTAVPIDKNFDEYWCKIDRFFHPGIFLIAPASISQKFFFNWRTKGAMLEFTFQLFEMNWWEGPTSAAIYAMCTLCTW